MVDKDILVIGSKADIKFRDSYQELNDTVFGKDNRIFVETLEKGLNHRAFRRRHVDYVILKCPVKEDHIQRYIRPMLRKDGRVIEDYLEKYSEMNRSAKKLAKQQLSSLDTASFSNKS